MTTDIDVHCKQKRFGNFPSVASRMSFPVQACSPHAPFVIGVFLLDHIGFDS